jgi:hypothetical protein
LITADNLAEVLMIQESLRQGAHRRRGQHDVRAYGGGMAPGGGRTSDA